MAGDARGPRPGLDGSLTVASLLLTEKGRPWGTAGRAAMALLSDNPERCRFAGDTLSLLPALSLFQMSLLSLLLHREEHKGTRSAPPSLEGAGVWILR